jgi:hypothetical protein
MLSDQDGATWFHFDRLSTGDTQKDATQSAFGEKSCMHTQHEMYFALGVIDLFCGDQL